MDLSELDSLQETLNCALNDLRAYLIEESLPPLSNYASKAHPLDSATRLFPQKVYNARKLALASLGQLVNLIQLPYEKVAEQSAGGCEAAAFNVFVKTGLVDELLAASPSNGLSVSFLSTKLNLDSLKLITVLRFLSTRGWVYEVKEGHFALQRCSFSLVEDSTERLLAENTFKNEVSFAMFDMMAVNSQYRHSRASHHTAFQTAFNTDLSLFDYANTNPVFFDRLSKAIKATSIVYEAALINDFPWERYQNAVLVDCGGGLGYMAINLAQILPTSCLVVQDFPDIVCSAREIFSNQAPEAAAKGRLVAEAHDFFAVQPRKANAYMFRHVLHDWPDDACIEILQNIVKGAPANATVLVMENLSVPSTVAKVNGAKVNGAKVNGAKVETIPAFIPLNLGYASSVPATLSLDMMAGFNSHSRTENDWRHIFNAADLSLVKVHKLRADLSVMECEIRLKN